MSSDLEIAVQYVDFILRWVSLLNNKIVNPKKKPKDKKLRTGDLLLATARPQEAQISALDHIF